MKMLINLYNKKHPLRGAFLFEYAFNYVWLMWWRWQRFYLFLMVQRVRFAEAFVEVGYLPVLYGYLLPEYRKRFEYGVVNCCQFVVNDGGL